MRRTARRPPGRSRTQVRSALHGPSTPATVPASDPVRRVTSQGLSAPDQGPGWGPSPDPPGCRLLVALVASREAGREARREAGREERPSPGAPGCCARTTRSTAPGRSGRSPTTRSSVRRSPSTTNVAYRSSGRRVSVASGARTSARRAPERSSTSSPGCRVTRTASSDARGRVMASSVALREPGSGPRLGFLCTTRVSTGPASCSLRHNPWGSAPTRGRPDVRPGDDTVREGSGRHPMLPAVPAP